MENDFIEAINGDLTFDVVDNNGIYMFYDCRAKIQIEDIPVGSEFEYATFDFCEGTLELQDRDNNTRKFKLKLSVISEIAL